ncbi:MAG: hydrogenase maturation protein [Woeseiaceae bacterium]|jgi:putative two-component system hydrogenase maturation factor HypX/HoxX|nr:hydrogenase maturation protein [Woeseiaceae bacterium]
MRILFLAHSFNSLTQRLFVELRSRGHEVSVEFDINDSVTLEAVEAFDPELIVAPFLKRAIPEQVWANYPCFVVHPGIVGDRGPSALDWAILDGETRWGVTVLQANAEMDAGDVWASVEFPMREASKSSLYRGEVTTAAVSAVLKAIERFRDPDVRPTPPDAIAARGRQRPLVTQADRAIDWEQDTTEDVLRKIRSGDGFPGVRSRLAGRDVFLYDARPAPGLSGTPGELVARSGPAVGVATRDGGIWVGHLKDKSFRHPFKLPAVTVLESELGACPEIPCDDERGYREITVSTEDGVAVIDFEFHNGAMSSDQCVALRDAFCDCRDAGARVIVLAGGRDFWSNGMHLNVIEASDSPADESWRNINAIDDLAEAVIKATDCLTVAALQGNTGAGGVFLARAADHVWAHDDVVLNPHYKDMGNLFGSEFWTYLLPRTCGDEKAQAIVAARLPMGAAEAAELGLVDDVIPGGRDTFRERTIARAKSLAGAGDYAAELRDKARRRETDEAARPLAAYRETELERMRTNFYGFDPSYHVARYNFVYKVLRSHTPLTIASHRRVPSPEVRKAS